MRRRRRTSTPPTFLLVFAACLAGAGVARAQPVEEPASDPAPAPEPPAVPAEDPASDPAQLEALYDDAFRALVAGEHLRAIVGFEQVAASSPDPDRRAAARELARLARALYERQAPGVRGESGVVPSTPVPARDSGDGRAEFIVSTTLASFYSGFVLVDLFNVDDYRPSVLLVSGTTAAGFLGSLYGTSGRRITGGMAESYTGGLFLGLANGLLLAEPLGIRVDADYDDQGREPDGEINESFLLFGLATMAAGGAAGLYLGDRFQPTRGQAMMVSTLAVAGAATVGLGYGIFQPDFDDEDVYLLGITAGLDAGAAAGIFLAPELDWSTSRVRLVNLGGFLGALAGFTLGALVSSGDDGSDAVRVYSTLVLVGGWSGVGLSAYLTRTMEPDPQLAAPPAGASMSLVPMGRGLGVAGSF